MVEEWRAVIDGHYEVSSLGNVRRRVGGKGARLGKSLRRFVASTGYYVVNVCVHGKPGVRYVHRLMVEGFIGPIGDGLQVNHLDGNKLNVCIDNLEVVTQAENAAHAGRTGLIQSGDRHWRSRRRTA